MSKEIEGKIISSNINKQLYLQENNISTYQYCKSNIQDYLINKNWLLSLSNQKSKEFKSFNIKNEKIDIISNADVLNKKIQIINQKISSLLDKKLKDLETKTPKKNFFSNSNLIEKNCLANDFSKSLFNTFILKKKLLISFMEHEDEEIDIDDNLLFNQMKESRVKSESDKKYFNHEKRNSNICTSLIDIVTKKNNFLTKLDNIDEENNIYEKSKSNFLKDSKLPNENKLKKDNNQAKIKNLLLMKNEYKNKKLFKFSNSNNVKKIFYGRKFENKTITNFSTKNEKSKFDLNSNLFEKLNNRIITEKKKIEEITSVNKNKNNKIFENLNLKEEESINKNFLIKLKSNIFSNKAELDSNLESKILGEKIKRSNNIYYNIIENENNEKNLKQNLESVKIKKKIIDFDSEIIENKISDDSSYLEKNKDIDLKNSKYHFVHFLNKEKKNLKKSVPNNLGEKKRNQNIKMNFNYNYKNEQKNQIRLKNSTKNGFIDEVIKCKNVDGKSNENLNFYQKINGNKGLPLIKKKSRNDSKLTNYKTFNNNSQRTDLTNITRSDNLDKIQFKIEKINSSNTNSFSTYKNRIIKNNKQISKSTKIQNIRKTIESVKNKLIDGKPYINVYKYLTNFEYNTNNSCTNIDSAEIKKENCDFKTNKIKDLIEIKKSNNHMNIETISKLNLIEKDVIENIPTDINEINSKINYIEPIITNKEIDMENEKDCLKNKMNKFKKFFKNDSLNFIIKRSELIDQFIKIGLKSSKK